MQFNRPDTKGNLLYSCYILCVSVYICSMIYWTESMSTGHGCIWRSFLNGSNASQLLDVDDDPQRYERSIGKRCSCPPMPDVASPIAMDYSTMGKTEIYFVDSTTKTIWATDQEGCQCREVYKDTQMLQGKYSVEVQ